MTKAKKNRSTTAELTTTSTRLLGLPQPRVNFDGYVETLMKLYRAHTQELFITGFDASAVLDDLETYHATLVSEGKLRTQLAEIVKTKLVVGARIWKAMLEVYQRAQSASRTNSVIKHAIAPFEQFMKAPHAKKTVVAAAPAG